MLTEKKIQQFYKDLEGLGLRFPVSEIAKKTGFSKGNVSDYINKKKSISESFINKFYQEFFGSNFVPRDTIKEEVPQGSIQSNAPLKIKVNAHDALLSVLAGELAALKASISGEHPEVVLRKIYKAAEDVDRLQNGE